VETLCKSLSAEIDATFPNMQKKDRGEGNHIFPFVCVQNFVLHVSVFVTMSGVLPENCKY